MSWINTQGTFDKPLDSKYNFRLFYSYESKGEFDIRTGVHYSLIQSIISD